MTRKLDVSKLSKAQRAALLRALSGDRRELPERVHLKPNGMVDFVQPARLWCVPPGEYVPERSEYVTARVLRRLGLFLTYPLICGYKLTPKGMRVAKRLQADNAHG